MKIKKSVGIKFGFQLSKGIVNSKLREAKEFLCSIHQYLPPQFFPERDSEDDDLPLQKSKIGQAKKSKEETEESNIDENQLPAKKSRAKTIEELKERFEAMKGSSKTYAKRIEKKKLKVELKKKLKLEARKRAKQLNKPTHFKVDKVAETPEPVVHYKPKSDGEIMFSRIEVDNTKQKKKSQDPRKLLDKIKENKTKIQELEASGKKDKAIKLKNKEKWNTAIKRAQGEKVKDNVELLKKTLQKKQNLKNRSKKKWEERLALVEKKKQDAQKKRQENIRAKIKAKKDQKVKRSIKKGRVVI